MTPPVLVQWFTKLSEKQFNMLVEKSQYFAQMKVDFKEVSGRFYTFYIRHQENEKEREDGEPFDFENHTEYDVLDVWYTSFKEYTDHNMNKK